jgi:hypothetical protein
MARRTVRKAPPSAAGRFDDELRVPKELLARRALGDEVAEGSAKTFSHLGRKKFRMLSSLPARFF